MKVISNRMVDVHARSPFEVCDTMALHVKYMITKLQQEYGFRMYVNTSKGSLQQDAHGPGPGPLPAQPLGLVASQK